MCFLEKFAWISIYYSILVFLYFCCWVAFVLYCIVFLFNYMYFNYCHFCLCKLYTNNFCVLLYQSSFWLQNVNKLLLLLLLHFPAAESKAVSSFCCIVLYTRTVRLYSTWLFQYITEKRVQNYSTKRRKIVSYLRKIDNQ